MSEKLVFPKPNLSHLMVAKGWGSEEIITNNEKYCGKILRFNAAKKCSFHYHKLKDETFYCAKGKIGVWHGDTDNFEEAQYLELKGGDSFHVPIGLRHQMIGIEEENVLIEFSTQHFEEDSIRVVQGDIIEKL